MNDHPQWPARYGLEERSFLPTASKNLAAASNELTQKIKDTKTSLQSRIIDLTTETRKKIKVEIAKAEALSDKLELHLQDIRNGVGVAKKITALIGRNGVEDKMQLMNGRYISKIEEAGRDLVSEIKKAKAWKANVKVGDGYCWEGGR